MIHYSDMEINSRQNWFFISHFLQQHFVTLCDSWCFCDAIYLFFFRFNIFEKFPPQIFVHQSFLLFLCSKLFRVFLLRSFFFNVVASSNLKLHFSHLISIKNLLFFLNQIPSTKKHISETHFGSNMYLKLNSSMYLRYMTCTRKNYLKPNW